VFEMYRYRYVSVAVLVPVLSHTDVVGPVTRILTDSITNTSYQSRWVSDKQLVHPLFFETTHRGQYRYIYTVPVYWYTQGRI